MHKVADDVIGCENKYPSVSENFCMRTFFVLYNYYVLQNLKNELFDIFFKIRQINFYKKSYTLIMFTIIGAIFPLVTALIFGYV